MTVTYFILLLGAKIWTFTILVKKYRKATILGTAVMVIAGVIHVDLLALEQKRIHEKNEDLGTPEAVKNEHIKVYPSSKNSGW